MHLHLLLCLCLFMLISLTYSTDSMFNAPQPQSYDSIFLNNKPPWGLSELKLKKLLYSLLYISCIEISFTSKFCSTWYPLESFSDIHLATDLIWWVHVICLVSCWGYLQIGLCALSIFILCKGLIILFLYYKYIEYILLYITCIYIM